MKSPLLQVKNLEVKYRTREGILTALRDTSFEIRESEIVGVVGESGCGKSTVASAVMRLLPPNGVISRGQILLNDRDLVKMEMDALSQLRGKDISMIFQDAMTSLNPVFSIEQQMIDAQRAHLSADADGAKKALRQRAIEMMDLVGIPDPDHRITEYPHQFSGGMRQRIMIAMALLSNPGLLVADEPTSALDVTLEAQILELICKLRDELGTAMLYITHDLGVIARLCDRVLVMYAGSIVESGDVFQIFDAPSHPYTQALLRSHPSHSLRAKRLRTIRGRVPSLKELPAGCKFAPRCDLAADKCHSNEPGIYQLGDRNVMCHAYDPAWRGDDPSSLLIAEPKEIGPAAIQVSDGVGDVVLETVQLKTHFGDAISLIDQILGKRGGKVRAVDGVTLQIRRGETLGLVGESGSGKTTLGRTVLRLVDSTAGDVIITGQEINDLSQKRLRAMRARMQMIFQDPFSSLSPRMKVSSLLLEPFRIHDVPADPKQKVEELLKMVLDVSVAAGILNLLKNLREELNLTYVVITHNLNVLSFIADRVAVMYLGKILELAPTEALFTQPKHPYTESLMSAIPIPNPHLRHQRERIILTGEIPSARTPPPGCAFHPRCRYAEARCSSEVPALTELGDSGRLTACHFPERVEFVLPWD